MSATIDQVVPILGGAAVTPSDTVDLAPAARALYVGVGGAIKVDTLNGSTLTFAGVSGGCILPVSVKRVYSTGTTASSIIALY